MPYLILLALVVLYSPSASAAYPYSLAEVIERVAVDHPSLCLFEADMEGSEERRREASSVTTVKEGENEIQLFEIWCSQGAYNVNAVYYLADQSSGLRQQHFAKPVLGPKDRVIGFSADPTLTNSGFDADKKEISFFSKSRGLGDCFHAGRYRFQDGEFVLKNYEVDSACDGRIRPKKIINYK